MNKLAPAFLLFVTLGLAACNITDDDCDDNVAGCDDGMWSCEESDTCYGSKGACEDSGDCD